MFEEVCHFEVILKGVKLKSVTDFQLADVRALISKELGQKNTLEKVLTGLSEIRDQHFAEPPAGDFLGRVGKLNALHLESPEDLPHLGRVV